MMLEWSKGYIQLLQDWAEWFQRDYNWRNFHFIGLEYEDEFCMGNREFVLYLLGIGVRIYWIYDDQAEMRAEVRRRMEQIKSKYGDKS